MLDLFGISLYYTHDWVPMHANLRHEKHEVGKRNTQKIERKYICGFIDEYTFATINMAVNCMAVRDSYSFTHAIHKVA